ncbi:hypothetical protein [Streptomyces spectabilis]|uniref:Uncharacterized protein n=1 Tax=Streptomyces spectabilis TaxID=68270 RepID=A0A516RF66_STRST|nr:hypothetical protein [Streptomyces spectabilis]QDQ14299.1 hypothetical protein FH965_30095 [Streptomyces spectabilis]
MSERSEEVPEPASAGMSWNDFLASLPEEQRKCTQERGHCDHDEHLTCCLCGYTATLCADPECDSLAYLGSDWCRKHTPKI